MVAAVDKLYTWSFGPTLGQMGLSKYQLSLFYTVLTQLGDIASFWLGRS